MTSEKKTSWDFLRKIKARLKDKALTLKIILLPPNVFFS